MKPKTKSLFFLFFLVSILGLFLIPNNVDATNYEWFVNGSFETGKIEPFTQGDYYPQGDYWVNSSFSHTGSKCLGTFSNPPFLYYLPLLDSDYFTKISLWTYIDSSVSSDSDATMEVTVWYNDWSYNTLENTTSITDSWIELTYEDFVDSDKYIIQIDFAVIDYTDVHLWDDFSLTATTQYGRMTWYLTPSAVSIDALHATVYKGLSYTFYGVIRDVSGNIDEDGTFQINSSVRGILGTGNVNNGLFNLILPKHTSGLNETTSEYLNVSVSVEDNFWVQLDFTFLASEGDGDGNGDDSIPDVNITTTQLLDFFMYGVFFLVIPLAVSVYTGATFSGSSAFNPTLGLSAFIGAETLIGAITLSIGFIDLWFMATIIIIDVLIIITMMRSS